METHIHVLTFILLQYLITLTSLTDGLSHLIRKSKQVAIYLKLHGITWIKCL